MKTVVAIWHSANKGKTETIREFANLLLLSYPSRKAMFPNPTAIPKHGDFRLVVEINGIIVGVESKGDPNTDLKKRLLDLADNYKCDIIICSTRTKGDTVEAVENLSNTRAFEIIWTSTYQLDAPYQPLVNQLKAKHILDLLRTLGRI